MDKKFYCNLKWDMAGINLSDQSIAQCCRTDWLPYDLEAGKENIIEIFNAPHVIEERNQTLDGVVPIGCKNCVEYENKGIQIQNDLLTTRQNIEHTTTRMSVLPTRIDFVLHNFCNLTCVYCGPIFSSSWTKDIIKNGAYKTKTISIKDEVRNKISLKDYESSSSFEILKSIVKHPDFKLVKKITLLGGEPLINPYLLNVVKDILDNNPTVELWITTGLGLADKRFFSIIDQLKQLDTRGQIGMNVSAETTGNTFELIRYGVTWADFTHRVKHLIKVFTHDNISIMTVLFILGIFDYKNFLQWLQDQGFDTKKIQFGYLEDPMYLSLLTFDRSVTETAIQGLLNSDLIADDLRSTLESTQQEQQADPELNKQFLEYIKDFSARRDLDINNLPEQLRNFNG